MAFSDPEDDAVAEADEELRRFAEKDPQFAAAILRINTRELEEEMRAHSLKNKGKEVVPRQ